MERLPQNIPFTLLYNLKHNLYHSPFAIQSQDHQYFCSHNTFSAAEWIFMELNDFVIWEIH